MNRPGARFRYFRSLGYTINLSHHGPIPMSGILIRLTCLLFGALLIHVARAELPPVDTVLESIQPQEGFVDLYWDDAGGRLLFAVDKLDERLIYQSSLARGVGSNDLGLDRGRLGQTRLVSFERIGPRVLMVQHNTGFRALSEEAAERQAVSDSFARSVVWGFDVVAETDGRVIVDGTEFFLRDADDMGGWLGRSRQGTFAVDPSRSAIYLPRTRAFPDNTEIEAIVTFTGKLAFDDNGRLESPVLSSVTPDPTAVSVHLHHSFVRLPDPGYEPMPYDPRAGFFPGASFHDYASPIGDPLMIRYARRHRLERSDPEAESSPAVEPVVYYVDRGAPEPVRSALIEGASWWNQAFEAAGFENAFRVELLPEDADPMDVRYNTIQWVHRSTRGWSYGYSVVDPRTGEIIKGHVSLGSLRVRQDFMIAEGLLAPYVDDEVPSTMLEMSLARIRQLSAHEVGHTLGIEHNFAASVNDRSSVMDYPFPMIRFADNGSLDLSDAYGVGIGPWDKRTIDYGYRDFPAGVDAQAAREAILAQTYAEGFLFVADGDSRNPGTAHPDGNLWDNGSDAIAELNKLEAVREYALERFNERVIRPGRAMATLEEALVPIYLLHRFQLQAVGKLLGGERFSYSLRGDELPLPQPVPAAQQEQALAALLASIQPSSLELPEDLLALIPPRPPEFEDDRERFDRDTMTTFDALSPGRALVALVLEVAFHPSRAARMNIMHATMPALPDFAEVLNGFMESSWYAGQQGGIPGALQRQTNRQVLQAVMALSVSGQVNGGVREQAQAVLDGLERWLQGRKPGRGQDAAWTAHYRFALDELGRLRADPARWDIPAKVVAPPGSPIGN